MKKIFLILFFLKGLLMGASLNYIKFDDKKIPLIYEKTNLPIFEVQFIFKNQGYMSDPKDKMGLTKLSAKILNEGSLSDGAIKFAKKLEQNAISLNFTNGFETFVIEVSSLIEKSKLAIKYLNEVLINPNLTNDSLKKIKTIIESKIRQKEVDYDYIANINLKKIMFENLPLANINLGTIDSIKHIELEDIKEKINNTFNINDLIIVAGANLNLDDFKKLIISTLKYFKDLKSKKDTYFEVSNNVKNIEVKKDTKQAYIYFGSKFDIKPTADEAYIAKVASFILGGGGFGSRLMEEIRVKEGLAYSAYGYIVNNKTHSYFKGYLQTKIESKDKAISLVKKVINDFVKNGVTQKELDSAKKFLLGSEPLRNETLSQRLNRAFLLYYKGLSLDYPKDELEKIKNLDLITLNNFIKKHTEIKNLFFSIVTKE